MGQILGLGLAVMLVLGGPWVATQWAAPQVYLESRGPALGTVEGVRVYPPWNALVWFIAADESVTRRIWPGAAGSLASVLAGSVLMRGVRSRWGARPGQPARYVRGAQWATKADLKRKGWL